MTEPIEQAKAADRLIVALDVPNRIQALEAISKLEGQCRWFKVGLELFLAEGPRFVEELGNQGFQIFLDLKLHDIPNTVASAIRAVGPLRPALLTVHALGGIRMLDAAQEAAQAFPRTRLLAVTVLTSMGQQDLQSIGLSVDPGQEVARLARMALSAGIPGLVCSPHELAYLREAHGPEALLVVPGVRWDNAHTNTGRDDQTRTAAPAQAIARGASKIVVGRPVLRSAEPARTVAILLGDIEKALLNGPASLK